MSNVILAQPHSTHFDEAQTNLRTTIGRRQDENACGAAVDLVHLSPLDAIRWLHWGEGAVVTFHRKDDARWQELGGVPLSELYGKWNSFKNYLQADAYFSINSTYQPKRPHRASAITGLPVYSRRAAQLRWLNAVCVDIDAGHNGEQLDLPVLFNEFAVDLAFSGLPRPNIVVFSGRGLWSLWSLCDPANFSRPVPAFSDKRAIYQRVSQAIVARFSRLGADPNATDPSRVMRVPGTINTKAAPEHAVVQFFKWSNERATLPQLATIVGVVGRRVILTHEKARPNGAKAEAGRMRWRIPLDGFRRLWSMRGYFLAGTRHSAVWIYALLLRRNRVPPTAILADCSRLAAACRPTLTDADVQRCISSSAKAACKPFSQSIRNETISRMLKITAGERAGLAPWFRAERMNKARQVERRRALIVEELQRAGKWSSNREWVSTRTMVCVLAQKHGLRTSHVTVASDYRVLCQRHFNAARSQRGKRGSASEPLSPSLYKES
jgi:hypothetical protein